MASPLLPLLALPGSQVPVLDERAWLEQLVVHRPALMMQHEGTMKDPAYWALVIKPKYRDEMLSDLTATWDTIIARENTDAVKASDLAWAAAARAVHAAVQPTATIRPARAWDTGGGYAIRKSASWDDAGLHYKVFFDFADFQVSLAGDRVVGFVKELDRRGFEGDFKFGFSPAPRFNYNQIIVHASSIAMGLCMEAVGLAWYGKELDHIDRGLDVVVDKRPYDWHHYLLTALYDQIPSAAKDYVDYRTPIPAKVCPID